ncbi:glutamate receptor 2.2 [Rhynchospora pubera]|uniref:Glutamate receptor n=1 Tax=Rhynchospora pubera TaxID=906938 RepID=A0AAV8HF49_9POAL|nr:glutamate receptor 2.2 [Rhynchospora pubera]
MQCFVCIPSSPRSYFFVLLSLLVWNQLPVAGVHVGVVLDLGSMSGKRCKTSMSMALEDFYTIHSNYSTRVEFLFTDSMDDVVSAASAAVDLLKNSQVEAIMGPLTTAETEFVAYLCNRSQVPMLSFSATSPSVSPTHLPFFVRANLNDSSQSVAIAAFIQHFGWRQAVPIYEESAFGSGIIPSLVDNLQSIGTMIPDRVVIPTEASDDHIDDKLHRLMTLQTRVFVVHMLPELASRLFLRVQALRMMSAEYVWIVTNSVADVLDLLDQSVINAMEGVIGFRPYIALIDEVKSFSQRFKERFRQDNLVSEVADPTIYLLWAYDAVWALAMANEMVKETSPNFVIPQNINLSSDLSTIGVSQTGPKLLNAILSTTFGGLAGNFRLVDGQLQLVALEIVDVVGKGARRIGFWTPDEGIIRDISAGDSSDNDNFFRSIIWPGDSTVPPKGWVEPTNGEVLRIAVPVKTGFIEFVDVSKRAQNDTSTSTITGYCIDVFKSVLEKLPYAVPYEFFPISIESYNDLVYQVYMKKFDAVVGDVTIRANRTNYVEFTMPYTESGVSMIVPLQPDSRQNVWIFLKPLSPELWLTSLGFFIFTGFVVGIIEWNNQEFHGTLSEQLGVIFYFGFSTLVFAHKEKLESNLSRFAVIIWVFVVLILTSSYTASLTSMLTVQQLQPSVTNINQLLKQNDYVGYQHGSFVKDFLVKLGFEEAKLRNLTTADVYAEALAKGSANGGVAAIFDEIPYLKVFLSQFCDNYTMAGPIYKTDGFGFVSL